MLLYILSFVISLIPSVLIIFFLRRRLKDDQFYKKKCNLAILLGLACILPIIILSGTLYLTNGILRITILRNIPTLVHKAVYNFIVLAFAEEIVKFLTLQLVLRKKNYAYTWADVVAFTVIVGTMFGFCEAIPYAIGASPIIMLIRGVTMGHVGYGFIMGWFYGKSLYTGKKRFAVLSVIVPWLIHGLYDFSLTPELLELNDNFAMIGVSLALADIVLLVLMIRFFIRARKHKDERYHQPLITLAEDNAQAPAEN